ncbi:efflux RND transporter periplasmic adaptor subunit [Hyalangium rubrum]|uniref:Efflux RND transporter periplasmic adaptor subunit n=1 Tax=Hyalangium rubrum TaxID=3103134 RepID=A0ABU5HBR3_9BACT|nr:efflux RND transporter periplasmic adaptor subunit [Hyalangium sp. s54d21]MDY7229510.1 efflux RND transporter periplasmic adaptor subunit [Hyalangium sp. s54d21]
MTPRSLSRLLLISTLASAAGMGCSEARANKAQLPATNSAAGGQPTLGVRATPPLDKLQGDVSRVTGQIRAKLEATLSAPATGTVAQHLVNVGDKVKKGAPMMVLDTSNMVISVEQAMAAREMAKAGLDSANTELERTQKLFEGGSAPQAVLDRAQAGQRQAAAGFAQADAAVRSAQEMLRDHTLRAPFDGVVTARMKNIGDTVAMMPPTPVFMVTNVDELEVRLPVPESMAGALTQGMKLTGRVIPGNTAFEATVRTVGAVVDAQSRTVEVLADVANKAEKDGAVLRPGSLAELDFSRSEALAGLFVPSQALLKDEKGSYVWVVEDGRLVRRDVQALPVTPRFAQVRGGLQPQDKVVVEGAASLREGLSVSVVQ